MDNLERVKAAFDELPYMKYPQAAFMRDFIIEHHARDLLEIGFYHGKSSAYFAAILEDLGRGHLVTIDKRNARELDPSIDSVLSTLDLSHRVTAIFAERSYTWEMGRMIRSKPRPQFDLCYFDGGHTWDGTGFGFLLVDMLLRPGGWIIFDDLKWTIEGAMESRAKIPKSWRACSQDEIAAPGVQLVFDNLVPHFGYTDIRTAQNGSWGIARKPLNSAPNRARPPADSLLKRIRNAVVSR